MPMQPEDRERLIKYVDFLESELVDFPSFSKVNWKIYSEVKATRRNIERWIENIVNCSIDIAKVLLVVEGLRLPSTYKEILRSLGATSFFDESFGNEISEWAALSIITHEYLDISWSKIRKFLETAEPTFLRLSSVMKKSVLIGKPRDK